MYKENAKIIFNMKELLNSLDFEYEENCLIDLYRYEFLLKNPSEWIKRNGALFGTKLDKVL